MSDPKTDPRTDPKLPTRITPTDRLLTAERLPLVRQAEAIATTSTAEKAERLKALGASEVINYTEAPDWDEKART